MKKSSLLLLSLFSFCLWNCGGNTYKQGGNLYKIHCESCHMADGTGLRGLIPPLANSDYLSKNKAEVACLIRYGMDGPVLVNGQIYESVMAGIPSLTDVQINNIINYINHSWGNDAGTSNVREVSQHLEACEQ